MEVAETAVVETVGVVGVLDPPDRWCAFRDRANAPPLCCGLLDSVG